MSAKLRLFSLIAGLAVVIGVGALVLWGPNYEAAGAKPGQTLTQDQRAAMEQVVHDTLVKHPEIIIEAVQTLEKNRKEADASERKGALGAHRKALVEDGNSVTLGNPHGDVTVVEFFDYRCPYCKQMEPSIAALLKQDTNVRFVLKEFPILGEDSVLASRAAIASRKQGKYEAFHDALMHNKGGFTAEVVTEIAREVGLDTKQLEADMADPSVDKTIRANHALAEALGIDGTPGFVIGDSVVSGGMPLDRLREMVADARKSCVTC